MDIKWMGRYRPFVAALVKHSNTVSRGSSVKIDFGSDIKLNSVEWQILEYFYEHGEVTHAMIQVSESLGIAQSSFSKCTNTLWQYGLVEKYHLADNKKNVIVRITEKGTDLYEAYFPSVQAAGWEEFFEDLAPLSDEELEILTRALNKLSTDVPKKETEQPMVKIEQKKKKG